LDKQHAVVVWIMLPDGKILFVRDLRRPPPIYWKCPGGRSEGEETPEQTALREVKEETGISINPACLLRLHQENRGNHVFFFFKAHIPDLRGLKPISDEEEETEIFTPDQIRSMDDFLPSHLEIAQSVGLLSKP